MSVIGRLTERMVPLPPAGTRKVKVERRIRIQMDDGTVLPADRWTPDLLEAELARTPVVLVLPVRSRRLARLALRPCDCRAACRRCS